MEQDTEVTENIQEETDKPVIAKHQKKIAMELSTSSETNDFGIKELLHPAGSCAYQFIIFVKRHNYIPHEISTARIDIALFYIAC